MEDFKDYHLTNFAKINSRTVPGENSQKLLQFQDNFEGNIVSYPRKMPIAIKRAKGAIIEDLDGNYFIDFFSCAGVLNLGHCNPYVLQYVKEQQENLIHALDFPTLNKQKLIQKLISQIPENLRDEYKVSFCGPTGSDAVEAALKLAKHTTGREGVIAFHGSYHGMTSGALSVTSHVKLREKLHSLVPNVNFIPYSYCYRCPFDKKTIDCKYNCAKYLQYILENTHSGVVKPAAIIIEAIQGEGGTIIPKSGFLERILEIAREKEIVVIFDEVQCGFYRTGKFWGFDQNQMFPDIITISKGIGGIGFPLSAIVYKKSIESWNPGDHIGTFRGNQVSIAAGNGAFDFIKEYNVLHHVEEISKYLTEKLVTLKNSCANIGEIRGEGLIFGIEYVKSQTSRVPDPDMAEKVRAICFANGLLFELGGSYNNVVRLMPPLIVNKEIIDNAFTIFKNANLEAVAHNNARIKESTLT